MTSSQFGERGRINVVSNRPATVPGSTGFGTDWQTAVGSAATLDVTGGVYQAQNNFVRRNDGVVVELTGSPDLRFTQQGTLSLTLEDGSLEFPLGIDRRYSVVATLPNFDI